MRWSDRRDDFRTEVLGLVKAQQVKNAVIVPVGSQGRLLSQEPAARGGDRDAIQAEAIRAYKTFLSGLLDITDNIDADNQIVPPAGVIVHDGEDPYLVVAADKGTATFSDIANGVAENYGFWLGDAFASGGSVGYDHKVMGITARGAWEAVKRHFRELGKDIQAEPFTVVGVGDMRGDVFGNGMLLSKQTKLFGRLRPPPHLPGPRSGSRPTSWAERDRMFKLPRSSRDDYDKSLISKGGGVFRAPRSRSRCRPEVRAMLEIKAEVGRAQRTAHRHPQGPGRAALFRRHRRLRESHSRKPRRRRRQGQRRHPHQRRRPAGQGGGRGRNLGFTQAGRIEFAQGGGQHQHRRHRQLGRRRQLRPRGQHQDPDRNLASAAAS